MPNVVNSNVGDDINIVAGMDSHTATEKCDYFRRRIIYMCIFAYIISPEGVMDGISLDLRPLPIPLSVKCHVEVYRISESIDISYLYIFDIKPPQF